MKRRLFFTTAKLVFIIAVPAILLILPSDFFDSGRSICISKLLLDTECYACGLTRACMHLIHFEIEDAFAYNMGSFISFPVLAAYWVYWFFKELKTFRILRKALRKEAAFAG